MLKRGPSFGDLLALLLLFARRVGLMFAFLDQVVAFFLEFLPYRKVLRDTSRHQSVLEFLVIPVDGKMQPTIGHEWPVGIMNQRLQCSEKLIHPLDG